MSIHLVDVNLENVEPDEVFEHSVIILRGKINCPSHNCIKTLNGKISVVIGNKVHEFVVLEGRFKSVIELKFGLNELSIDYKDVLHSGHLSLQLQRKFKDSDKVMKLFYIVPKGDSGRFQSPAGLSNSPETACQKIVTGVKLLQCLVAERLNEQSLGRKTFAIFSNNGEEVCEVFYSQFSKDDFLSCTNSEAIWNMTAKELLEKEVFTSGVKVLAFLSCTEYSKDLNKMKGYVACGRGHFALVSSLGLHSWASNVESAISSFNSKIPLDPSFSYDTSFRGVLGGCYSTTLGAALHEMGHVFDLVHFEVGIMGRGFEDVDLFFLTGNRGEDASNSAKSTSQEKLQHPTISVRARLSIKMESVNFGFQDVRNTKSLECDGQALFHRSAAVLLSGHPWFNVRKDTEDNGPIEVCGLEVRAPNALRLIELHVDDDRLVKYWDFTKNPNRVHKFRLTLIDLKGLDNPSILIQDTLGKIITQKLYPSVLIPI